MTAASSEAIRAVLVAGARPNFMKVAPVLWELERRGHEVMLVHSGQHYDPSMSGVFFGELGIREPDVNLRVGSSTQAKQTAGVMVAFEPLVADWNPDIVVVVGDVNSTVACALVAAKAGVRVAHVEAGLRSRDWAMPEEINRVVTDRLSDHLLAPSADACSNLRSEGYRDDQISLVGNVMVDTLLTNRDRALARPTLEEYGLTSGEYGLVTLHRPSNVDDDTTLAAIIAILEEIADDTSLVFPAHPRTRARLDRLVSSPRLSIVDPAGYLDFVNLQANASVVLTDSGGVQEETTMLGVPCLTLRENTERPVTVSEGTNRVVGTDRELILANVADATSGRFASRRPGLWDGKASERIVDVFEATRSWCADQRPTSLGAVTGL